MFKKTAVALALVGASMSAQSATIVDMTMTSGTFFMQFVTPAAIAWTNTTNPGADLVDGYVNLGPLFNFFGGDVTGFTQDGSVGVPGGPVPSGDADLGAGTITVDLSAFTAFWNGTNFNQGNASVSGTVDANGDYSISWSSLINGGPFNGFTGTWTATGHVNVVPEAETYAMMLAGLGVVGLMARRRRVA